MFIAFILWSKREKLTVSRIAAQTKNNCLNCSTNSHRTCNHGRKSYVTIDTQSRPTMVVPKGSKRPPVPQNGGKCHIFGQGGSAKEVRLRRLGASSRYILRFAGTTYLIARMTYPVTQIMQVSKPISFVCLRQRRRKFPLAFVCLMVILCLHVMAAQSTAVIPAKE